MQAQIWNGSRENEKPQTLDIHKPLVLYKNVCGSYHFGDLSCIDLRS